MPKKNYPKADFREENYEKPVSFFFPGMKCERRGDEQTFSTILNTLDKTPRFFAAAVKVAIQEREHKLSKIYSTPVLQYRKDELGKGKRANILQNMVLAKMQ